MIRVNPTMEIKEQYKPQPTHPLYSLATLLHPSSTPQPPPPTSPSPVNNLLTNENASLYECIIYVCINIRECTVRATTGGQFGHHLETKCRNPYPLILSKPYLQSPS